MHRYQHIAVALSRTDADAGLIRYADLIANLGTAVAVRFVHVLPDASGSDQAPAHDRVLADLREQVRRHWTGAASSAAIDCEVLHGPLTDELLSYAAQKHIELLLVGHRHDASGRNALARRLAMNAPSSVWMVPQDAPARIERILVPVDFSDHAADTMRVAASMARLKGHAECLALHVYFNEAVITYEGYDQVLRGQEAEAFVKFLAPINTQGVSVTTICEEGANVAHVIGRIAEKFGADLIVMATRGRSRSAAILLGSVTEETILQTRVPVLAVKHFGARLGVLQALLDRRFLLGGGVRTD